MKIMRTETYVVVTEGQNEVKFLVNGSIEGSLFRVKKNDLDPIMESLFDLRPDFKVAAELLSKDIWGMSDIANIWENTCSLVWADPYKGEAGKRWYTPRLDGLSPVLRTDDVIVKDAVKVWGIPGSKAFRKLYLEDLRYMNAAKALVDAGVKDPNRILAHIEIGRFISICGEWAPVLEKIVKFRGEEAGLRFVEEAKEYDEFYPDELTEADIPDKVWEFVLKQVLKPQDVWNSLVCYKNTAPPEDTVFDLSLEDERLEGKIGVLEFKVPRSTRELVVLGADMGICVGDYGPAVKHNKAKIVAAYEGGKAVACFDCPGKRIIQMKGRFNNPVPSKYKKAVEEWAQANGLHFDCEDDFGPDEIVSTERYDRLGLEDFNGGKTILRAVKLNYWLYTDELPNEEELE